MKYDSRIMLKAGAGGSVGTFRRVIFLFIFFVWSDLTRARMKRYLLVCLKETCWNTSFAYNYSALLWLAMLSQLLYYTEYYRFTVGK